MRPKKILFANVPADGHFNPLTGLAKHLKNQGHDVRWYTQNLYKERIERMGIPYYPFVRPPQLNQLNFESYFSERSSIKGQVKKMQFDLENVFIRRSMEHFYDIRDIYEAFPFDLMIADVMCTVIPFVKEKLKVPVISIGVVPVSATSKDLPPSGLGLVPGSGKMMRLRQGLMRLFVNKFVFGKANKLFRLILKSEGIEPPGFGNMFDLLYKTSTLVLQSGTPGFEFSRSDLGENIRFVGPMLPYQVRQWRSYYLPYNYRKYKRKVLVTQGTVEKDSNKLIIPALEAFRNTDTLVIVTTGGSNTELLKSKYPDENFLIEDFIPFADIMPYCDAYVTNGGYGGVLLSVQHKLPMVVAGVHEGKNEINARVGYFNLGVNLGTETPGSEQIREAVEKVFADKQFKENVTRLAQEFSEYDPCVLCENYIAEIMGEVYEEEQRLAS